MSENFWNLPVEYFDRQIVELERQIEGLAERKRQLKYKIKELKAQRALTFDNASLTKKEPKL